jgi:hypothetical protein
MAVINCHDFESGILGYYTSLRAFRHPTAAFNVRKVETKALTVLGAQAVWNWSLWFTQTRL